jgi:hypothetical protein
VSRFDWDRVRRERGLDQPWSPDPERHALVEYDRERRATEAEKRRKARERAASREKKPGTPPVRRAKKRMKAPNPFPSTTNALRPASQQSLRGRSIVAPASPELLREATRFAVSAGSWRSFQDWLSARHLGNGHLVLTDQRSLLAISGDGDHLVLRRATTEQGNHVAGLPGRWSELGRAPRRYKKGPEALAAAVRQATTANKPRQLHWIQVTS